MYKRQVEKFALLLLLYAFNQQAQLLAYLVIRIAKEIGNAGVYVENRIDAAQSVFSWRGFILNERRGQGRFIFMPAERLNYLALIDFVQSKGSRFKGLPIQ